ncbi:baseplate J/gp47 family protein [Roseibium sp. HPY-6]|uniref:baseplate J/gp47 family protein n=1 Tax=Roseibium sp. HPY-6 TaxID=3229852 RepID=UPI00338FDB7A
MSTCDRRGPLSRTGTAQPDRDIAERRADHFQLDERDVADLIQFGRRFARQIRFYAKDGAPAGDWSAFFDSDISAVLASIAKLPVDPFRRALGDAKGFLEDDPSRPEAQLRAHLALVFHLPIALLQELTLRLSPLEAENPFRRRMTRLLETSVAPRLAELARYHQGGVDEGVILASALSKTNLNTSDNPGPGPQIADEVRDIIFNGEAFEVTSLPVHVVGGFAATGWSDFYDAQTPDPSPYLDGSDTYAQIYDALNYNLLVSSMERVFQALARARKEAEAQLQESLTDFARHTPHYGLWLAFLSMYDRARSELNAFTGRHMDFYFEDVLRLSRKAPTPDHVHLLVNLARGTEAHLLPAGTLVRAGKDATGADVAYALEEDFVANRALVTELRSVRVNTKKSGGKESVSVQASPITASSDGIGDELPEETPHFAPFGPEAAPFARLGFAVADRQLFMREGSRVAKISFKTAFGGSIAVLKGFKVRLTTEEGWLELSKSAELKAEVTKGTVVFTMTLAGNHPPIVPHDPAVHEGPYPTGVPVAEILLDWDGNEAAASSAMAVFRNASRNKVKIQTEATGLRQMSVRTDDGTADPSAVFTPFGAQPRKNARWILGSSEVFSRPLDTLTVNVTWAEAYVKGQFFENQAASAYQVGFDYLSSGSWQSGDTKTISLQLDGTGTNPLAAKGTGKAPADAELLLEDPSFDAKQRTGFMRMTLNRDFGHDRYLDAKTLALIDLASGNGIKPVTNLAAGDTIVAESQILPGFDPGLDSLTLSSGLPNPPYTPEIAEISIDYAAKQSTAEGVWRVHPFGVEPANGSGRVLPDLPFEGALFIGVDALDPSETFSLLVQVADGTGDPLLELPDLDFAWLKNSGWTKFKSQEVIDRTGGLAGSGLLSFAVPTDASSDAPHMPPGLHWFRISVAENADAVNRLHLVAAQAVRASFVDRGNDPVFLESALPAGTISKLLQPDPAVKSLEQPFASFGGRGLETPDDFRRRVSERLRHKDRAVTMWDYEHLALESNRSVYRAKCLNHTELKRQAGKVVGDNEMAPGAVTFVAVPYTFGTDLRDPLRPYSDQATLHGLHEHLARRCSPFVRLETANPKFEEIHVSMNVAFREGIADTDFYRKEIETALIGHLTPWTQRGARGVEFGGRIYKSTVIDFVEELPFVDYLEDVKLFHRRNPDGPVPQTDLEIIQASTARSVLVSARSHSIGLV